MDITSVCEEIDAITLKHKYIKVKMDLLIRKVDLVYYENVLDQLQEDDEQMSPYSEALFTPAIEK